MFLDEENDPKTKKSKPRALDNLSVPELKAYIEDLQTEIKRVEADITRKESRKAAAESFFGKPPG